MIVRDAADVAPMTAADGSELREILHPDRNAVEIGYSLAHAEVAPGASTVPHRLSSTEVYYLLSGTGRMHIDEETLPVHAGNAVYIPRGCVQWIENTGQIDLAFLCIVDPAWKQEDEEILSG